MTTIETLANAHNWTDAQTQTAKEILASWASQNRQLAAWSEPVAAR